MGQGATDPGKALVGGKGEERKEVARARTHHGTFECSGIEAWTAAFPSAARSIPTSAAADMFAGSRSAALLLAVRARTLEDAGGSGTGDNVCRSNNDNGYQKSYKTSWFVFSH